MKDAFLYLQINSGLWRGCTFDEANTVEVGRLESFEGEQLMREKTNGRGNVFVLNTTGDDTNACYFTTMDIDLDELHNADIELNNLEEFEHEMENLV